MDAASLVVLLETEAARPGQAARLVGVLSMHQMAVGSIPCQGTYLGCRCDPQSGYVQEATDQHFSLSHPLTLPLSLKSINISLGVSEDLKKPTDDSWAKATQSQISKVWIEFWPPDQGPLCSVQPAIVCSSPGGLGLSSPTTGRVGRHPVPTGWAGQLGCVEGSRCPSVLSPQRSPSAPAATSISWTSSS